MQKHYHKQQNTIAHAIQRESKNTLNASTHAPQDHWHNDFQAEFGLGQEWANVFYGGPHYKT